MNDWNNKSWFHVIWSNKMGQQQLVPQKTSRLAFSKPIEL
jgi:hypothetical protein